MSLRVQLCCAHPGEAQAVMRGLLKVGLAGAALEPWILGVGKVPFTVSLMQHLSQEKRAPKLLLLVGVAGVYPKAHRFREAADGAAWPGDQDYDLGVGDLCLVHSDRLVDEGVQCESEFLDLDQLSLRGEYPRVYTANFSLNARLEAKQGWPQVRANTVSTAAGCERLSKLYAQSGMAPDGIARAVDMGAMIESMEGAALAHVAHVLGISWISLRAISNRCGDREQSGWDLPRALDALARGSSQLLLSLPDLLDQEFVK